ncbi:hypothetical protein Bca101_095010 [Brassica carinata]
MVAARHDRSVNVPLVSTSHSFASEDEDPMSKVVSLSSTSKPEVKTLKLKLISEVDKVRIVITRYCSKDFDEVIKKENKGKNKEDHNERKRRSGMKRGGRVDARGRYYLHKDIISIRILSSLLTR